MQSFILEVGSTCQHHTCQQIKVADCAMPSQCVASYSSNVWLAARTVHNNRTSYLVSVDFLVSNF